MESEEELLNKRLEDYTYRQLQQLAKSMQLPSNFKKVYLIELIEAKKFKTEVDVLNIIDRVKKERFNKSKAKRQSKIKKTQAYKTKNAMDYSPPITQTPKRQCKANLKYSPDYDKTLVSLNPKRSLLRSMDSDNQYPSSTVPSDRILRSYNVKTVEPDYTVTNDYNTECYVNTTKTKFKVITNGGGYPQVNVTTKTYIRKNDINMINNNSKSPMKHQKQMLSNGVDLIRNSLPSKRERTVSGIYPLLPAESKTKILNTNNGICIRQSDGSYTKINALIQKCSLSILPLRKNNHQNTEINVQDIINDSVDANLPDKEINNNMSTTHLKGQCPNTSGIDKKRNNVNVSGALRIDSYKENTLPDEHLIDYDKTIKNAKIPKKFRDIQEQLPNIGDTFTKFADIHRTDLPLPLYLETSTGSESGQNLTCVNQIALNPMLETLYNVKTNTVVEPNTPAITKSVYSTDTVVTASMYPSTVAPPNDALNVTSLEAGNYPLDLDMRLNEFLELQAAVQSIQNTNGESVVNSPSSPSSKSPPTNNHDDTTTTDIAEMLEDAFEIISQDGDYIEELGMAMRVQCVLCSWAGPQIVLECHVRKEHTEIIHKEQKMEWNITYTLESLVESRVWLNRVMEYDSTLYLLSVKYEEPGCVMATLSSLSTDPGTAENIVSITIYNKITGEPYSWKGQISTLPPNLPYENNANCLKVDLAKLDLLPNSANLRLVNRELVTESPSKVVVGQPDLNDIHVILFIKILN